MIESLIIIIGKLIVWLSKIFNLGSGSTWPGHIALKLDKDFIKKIFLRNKQLKKVIVAGTNGKTTTTLLIKNVIQGLGKKTFSNEEGANLLNGIASSLIKNSNFFGKIDFDYGVFESDEFSFPLLLEQMTPDIVVILNLFRDQLDRYGEVNTIGIRWFRSLKNLPQASFLIVNGDDPYLYHLARDLKCKVYFFGVDKSLMKLKKIPHDVDFNYCPICNSLLKYKSIAYAHLGDYYCNNCQFRRENIKVFKDLKIKYPLEGLYNIYNTNAVLALSSFFLKADLNKVKKVFLNFEPAFGRQEEVIYKNRRVFILLSKNPAGFNQSIKTVIKILKNKKANFLILLNDRIPDGQDVSWIWDVDFDLILKKARTVFVSGDRKYDMYLRLKYAKPSSSRPELAKPGLGVKEAIDKAVLKTKKNERLYILTTYSAMLEARKILVGRKFL